MSRDQLRSLAIIRHEVVAHVAGQRWRPVHTQSVAVHTGPLSVLGRQWAAVFEGGGRSCLDGASALIAEGLEHYTEDVIRVSVPRGVVVRRAAGIAVRQTRRLRPEDLVPIGVPRTRPDVAGVRAALWARSDKQATLLLTMAVQQRLTTPERLGAQALTVKRDSRRLLVTMVIGDLLGGVRSLGEHEFAHECRRRGIPEPSRQVLRRSPEGRWYLDVCWDEWGVVSRSTASSTSGPPTSCLTPSGTTQSRSSEPWCSDCHCSDCGWLRMSSSPRSERHSQVGAAAST